MESPREEAAAGESARATSKHKKASKADADAFHKVPTSTDMPPPKEPRRNRTSRRKSSQAVPLPLDSTDSDATHESVSSWRPSLGVHSYKWEQQRGRDSKAFESSGRQGRSREREYERSESESRRARSAARLSASAARLQGTDSEDSVKPVQRPNEELRRVRSVRHRFSDREHSVSKKPEPQKHEEQQKGEERPSEEGPRRNTMLSDREHSVCKKPEQDEQLRKDEKQAVREEQEKVSTKRLKQHSVSKKPERHEQPRKDDKQVVREEQQKREEKRPKEKREASSRDALKTESMGASNSSVKTKKKQEEVAASDSFSFMKEDSPEAEEVSSQKLASEAHNVVEMKAINVTTAPLKDKSIGQLNRWDSAEAQIRQVQDASSEETGWPKKSGERKFEWAAELESATRAAAESEARPPFKKVDFNSAETAAVENVVESKKKSKKKKHNQKENQDSAEQEEKPRSRSPFKALFGQSAKTEAGEERARSKSPFNFLKFGRSSKTERPKSKSPLKKQERARSKSPFSMRWFRKDVETKGEESRARSKSPFFGRKKEQVPEQTPTVTRQEFKPSLPALEGSKPEATKEQGRARSKSPFKSNKKEKTPPIMEDQNHVTAVQLLFVKGHLPGGDLAILNPGAKTRAKSMSPFKEATKQQEKGRARSPFRLFSTKQKGCEDAQYRPTKERSEWTEGLLQQSDEEADVTSAPEAATCQLLPLAPMTQPESKNVTNEEGDVSSAPTAATCQLLTPAPDCPASENVAVEELLPKESETNEVEDGQVNDLNDKEKVPEPLLVSAEEDEKKAASKSPPKLSRSVQHSVSTHKPSESANDISSDVSTSVLLSETAQKEVARRLAAVTGSSKGLGFWENRVQDFNRRRSLKLPRGKSAVPEAGSCYGPEAPLEQDMPDFPADEPLPSLPQGPSNSPERAEPSDGPEEVDVAALDAPLQSPPNSPPSADPSDGPESKGQGHVTNLDAPLLVAQDPLDSPPSKKTLAIQADTKQQVHVAVPDSPPESFFTIEIGKASVEVEKGESWSSKNLKLFETETEQLEEASGDNEAKQEESLGNSEALQGDIGADDISRESPKKKLFEQTEEVRLEKVRATTALAVSVLKSPQRPAAVRYTDPRSAFQELMNEDNFSGRATPEAVDAAAKSPKKKGVLSGVASWLRKKSPTKMRAEADVRDSKEGLAWDGGLDHYLVAREELKAPRDKPHEVAGRISYSDLVGISKTLPKPLQSAASAPVRHQNEATKSIQELVAAFYSLGSSPDVKEKASDAGTQILTSEQEGLLQIVEGNESEENATPEKPKTASFEACEMQAVCNENKDVASPKAGHVSSEDQNPKTSGEAFTSCPSETLRLESLARSPEPLSCEDDDEVLLGEDDALSAFSDGDQKLSGKDTEEETALSSEVGEQETEAESVSSLIVTVPSPVECDNEKSLSEETLTAFEPLHSTEEETQEDAVLTAMAAILDRAEQEIEQKAFQGVELAPPVTAVSPEKQIKETGSEEEALSAPALLPPVTAVSPEKQVDTSETAHSPEEEALSEAALPSPVTAHSPDKRTPICAAGPRLSWSKTSPTESAEDPLKLWRAMAYPDGRASVNFEEALESRRHLGLAAADVALSHKTLPEVLEPLPEEGDVAEQEASVEIQSDGPDSWAPAKVEKKQVQVILAQKWDEFIKDFEEPAARASPQRPPLVPKTLKPLAESAAKKPAPLVLDLAEFSEASPLKEATDESLGEEIHEDEELFDKPDGLFEEKNDSCQTPGANKRGFFSAWWKGAKSSPANPPTKKETGLEEGLEEACKPENQGVTDALLAAVADGVAVSDMSVDSLSGHEQADTLQLAAKERVAESANETAAAFAKEEPQKEDIAESKTSGGDSTADGVALHSDGKSSPANLEPEADNPFDEAVYPVKEADSLLADHMNDLVEGGEGNAGLGADMEVASSLDSQTAQAGSTDETARLEEVIFDDDQAMLLAEQPVEEATKAPVLKVDVALAQTVTVADTELIAEEKILEPKADANESQACYEVLSADGLSLNRNLSPRRGLERGNFSEEEAQWGNTIPDVRDDSASERRPSLEPLDANRATERTSLPGNGRPSQTEDGFQDENASLDRGLEKSDSLKSEEVSEESRTVLAARPPTRRSTGEYARSASSPEIRVRAVTEPGLASPKTAALQEELAEMRARGERAEAEKGAIEKRWKASRKELKNVRKYTDGLEKEVDLMTALLKATEEAANAKMPVHDASVGTEAAKLTDAACDPLLLPSEDKSTSTTVLVLVEKAVSPEPGPVFCDASVGADHVAFSEAGVSTEQGLFTQEASVGTGKAPLFDKGVGTESIDFVGKSELSARETAAVLSEKARASAKKKAPVIDTSKGSSPARADSVTSTTRTREKSVGTEGLSETGILEHKVHLLRSQIKDARQQRDSLQKELERAADEKAKLASKLADSEKVKPPRDAPYEMHELHRSLGKWQARAQRAEQELTRVNPAQSSRLKQKSPIARALFSTGKSSSSNSSREGSPVEKLRGIPEEVFDTWQDRALAAEKQAAERKLELWKVIGELEIAKEELEKGSEEANRAVDLEAEVLDLKGKLRRMHDDALQMREEIAILRSTLEGFSGGFKEGLSLEVQTLKEESESLKTALAKERETHKKERLEWRETSNRLKTLLAFWPEEVSEAKEESVQGSNGFASPIHVAAAQSFDKAASDVRESSESSSRDFEGFSPGPVETTEQFEMDKEVANPLSPNKPKSADLTQNEEDKAVLKEKDSVEEYSNEEGKGTKDSATEYFVEKDTALPKETKEYYVEKDTAETKENDVEEKRAVARTNGASSLLVRRNANPVQSLSVKEESGELSPAESVSPVKAIVFPGGGVSSPVNLHPLTRTGSWRSPQSPAESESRYGSPQPSPTSTKYGSPGSSPGTDWGTCRDSNDTWRVKSGPLTKTMAEPRSASPGAFARTMDELVVPRRPSPGRGSKELPRWGSRESTEWTNALQRRDKLAGIETVVEIAPTSEEKKLPRRRLSKKKATSPSPSK